MISFARRWLPVFLLCVLVGATCDSSGQPFTGSVVAVQGSLIDGRTGQAAPGLMVSLIHPVLGRSLPSYSNAWGSFGWVAIPSRTTWKCTGGLGCSIARCSP